MKLGHAIRLIRTAKQKTQKELAEDIGYSSNHLSLVERGQRKPSVELVEKIAKALGISEDIIYALAVDQNAIESTEDRSLVEQLKQLMMLSVAQSEA